MNQYRSRKGTGGGGGRANELYFARLKVKVILQHRWNFSPENETTKQDDFNCLTQILLEHSTKILVKLTAS